MIFQAIKQKVNLLTYLKKYMEFDNTGHALCPFHGDVKTRSFYVKDEQDDKWYCFGCGAGGDIFDFVERYHNYSKTDAMKSLAQEFGVKLSEEDSKTAKAVQELQEKNKRIVENAKSQLNERAMTYLKERGIEQRTIEFFEIGYFGNNIDAIYIPIKEKFGKTVGGSLRFLAPDADPKYKNASSDKYDFFKKREILYGLPAIRNKIKDRLYIVEGYFDVMSAWQAGFETTVGILGSIFTKDQVTILSETISNEISIVLVPDNPKIDKAGRENLMRNYQLLRMFLPNNPIHIALFPDLAGDVACKDFNDYINNGSDFNFMTKTKHVETYLVRQIAEAETDKQKQFLQIKKFLETIHSPIIKAEVMDELADIWGKPTEVIENYFKTNIDDVNTVGIYGILDLSDKYEIFIKNSSKIRIHFSYRGLDKDIRGLNPGELMFVMARSGVGKTAFVLNLLKNITKHQDVNALLFSLEQQGEQIFERSLSISSGLEAYEIEQMFLNGSEGLPAILRTLQSDFGKIYTIDKDSLTIEQIEKLIIQTNMVKQPVQVVAIDYMGYIKHKYLGDPYVSTSIIAKELKALAKRLRVALIVLLQLNREGGTGGTPVTIRMARDSGVVEESGDIVLGLWRNDLVEGLDEAKKLILDKVCQMYVGILKNRAGAGGAIFKLNFEKPILRITDY